MASVARYDGETSIRDATVRTPRRSVGPDPRRSINSLIELEIIPRLMAAHAGDACRIAPLPGQPLPASTVIDPAEVEALAPLTLQVEADALLAHVESLLARGITADSLLVDLLAPTARLLGEYWEQDRCDFVDVTMALWRLQEVVHEIAARAPAGGRGPGGGHSALFASMPGDQHDFGTLVIDELFQRDGWRTDRLNAPETTDLLKHAGESWFDLIGLTVSRDCHIAALPSTLVALRNVSRNPRVCIMVGGRIFSADPGLAATVGADGTARDARLALKRASELVRAREERC